MTAAIQIKIFFVAGSTLFLIRDFLFNKRDGKVTNGREKEKKNNHSWPNLENTKKYQLKTKLIGFHVQDTERRQRAPSRSTDSSYRCEGGCLTVSFLILFQYNFTDPENPSFFFFFLLNYLQILTRQSESISLFLFIFSHHGPSYPSPCAAARKSCPNLKYVLQ